MSGSLIKSAKPDNRQVSEIGEAVNHSNVFTFPSRSVSLNSQIENFSENKFENSINSIMSRSLWKSSDSQQHHFRRVTETKRSFSSSVSLSSSSTISSSSAFSTTSSSGLSMRRGKRGLILQPLGELKRRILPGFSFE